MPVLSETRPEIRRHGKRLFVLTHARAAPELGAGVVEAYTSVFGVEFAEGSGFFGSTRQVTIDPGAFDETLANRPTAPIMWEHNWDIGPIGQSIEEEATERGLHMLGELFLDQDLPARVYRTMKPKEDAKAGAVTEWSIAFWPKGTFKEEREDQDPLYHYTKIDRAEHSVVLRGANPDTETISVNSRGMFVDGHGEALDAPCTGLPSEFTLAGRRYVAAPGEAVAPIGAARMLAEDLTIAGVRYVAVDPDPDAETPSPTETDSIVPGAEQLLERPAVREAFGPR